MITRELVFAVGNEHRADRARARAYLEGQIDDLFDGSLVTLKKTKTREDFFRAYCKRRKTTATRAE
jgi:hypothetical protein